MVKVSTFVRTAICALALVGASAFAQTPAKDALKAINDFRTGKFTEARTSGKQINIAEIDKEVKAKAEEAVKGIDPSKVEAKDAYDWAQLFQLAQQHKAVCDLAHKFLTTNPGPDQKFAVQMMMMTSCNALGEGEMLIMTIKDIKPVNSNNGRSLMSSTVYLYADTIAKSQGVDAAIKALDDVLTKAPATDHKAYAQQMLTAQKAREAQNPPATAPKPDAERLVDLEQMSKNQEASMQFSVVDKKAELLKGAGRKPEAVKLLKSFIATVADPKSPILRSANSSLKQMEMVGAPAAALTTERSYGEFKGLDSLKGKVVIIDFFAHWCGPCKASYPDMTKMYGDLKGKGLEIVGFTTYYGFYNQEKNLEKDAEYAKMADFIKEFNISWPVAYGERTNFDAYGITGIPTTILIDRKGNVHSVDVGYSPESFKKFRAEVEKLLGEK